MDKKDLLTRFKRKMNGLKLTKKINKDQVEAISWALDNEDKYPELMDSLYIKEKPFDEKQFNLFWDRLPQEMKRKKKDAARHWKSLNPDDLLFKDIVQGLENQKVEKGKLKRAGKFCPEWPTAAAWIYQRRWEDAVNMHPERESSVNPDMTACARTARILEEAETARQNRVVNVQQALDPNLRRMLSKGKLS